MTVLSYLLCAALAVGAIWFLWYCWCIIQKDKNNH